MAKAPKAKGKKIKTKSKKAGEYRKVRPAAFDIGIIHSGRPRRRQQGHVDDFKAGLALFSGDNPRAVKWGRNKKAVMERDALDLINDGVQVLVAAGGSQSGDAAIQAAAATSRPVVVTSMSRLPNPVPSNLVGVSTPTSQQDIKRLELLVQCLPGIRRVGALYNSKRTNATQHIGALRARAGQLNVTRFDDKAVDPDSATSVEQQIESIFQGWSNEPPNNKIEGVIVVADPLFNDHVDRVLFVNGDDSSFNNLRPFPGIYQWRQFAREGGLISYGPNLEVAYTVAGTIAGRLASGTPVSQLSLVQLQSFDLVINLKAAEKLGKLATIPPEMLAQATDLIT